MMAVALALALGSSVAHADGLFVSPDGAHRVTVTRRGDFEMASASGVVARGRMPWGPPAPLNPDIPIGGRFESALWSADGQRVAVFGRCRGYSGVAEPPTPRCSKDFVRVLSPAQPEQARSLAIRWPLVADEARVAAIGFDPSGARLAALVVVEWSDCSFGGHEILLVVWSLHTGAREQQRRIAERQPWAPREIAFEGEAVRVSVGRGGRRRTRVFAPPGNRPR